jgi:tetratricopeptide (TPR) repeat protein
VDGEAIKEVLQRHGASFVLDDFDFECAAADGRRDSFLDRITFKLSRRSDLSDTAREDVFACARELSQALPVQLVSSDQIGEAQRRLLQLVAGLKADKRWPAFEAAMQSWPSPIAHELARLLSDLESSPEAALFQLRDAVETLLKFPALVLARALIERGAAEDARKVRSDCFGRLSGGNWLGLAREWAARVLALPALAPLHALARTLDTGSAFYRMFDGFSAVRNSEIGHGAHRLDPRETATMLRVLVLGDDAAAAELRMPGTVPLIQGLSAAVALDPWQGMKLVAGDGDAEIELIGAGRLSAWHCDPMNGPGKEKHQEKELPVRLVFATEPALDLAPFVRARICAKCDYRDVFLFDALNDDKSDGQFDLLDYSRGHKMRRRGRRVPDLLEALKAVDRVERPPRVEGALSSRDVVEQLDAARVDRRYRSPGYLRDPLAAFLRERTRGVYWLQAPAHVGKTTLVQGLAGLDPQPLIARDDPTAVVAAFFCKREYREGAATFVNGLERALERALDIRVDANAKKPSAGAVLDANDRAAAFLAWLDEWRDFARAQHGFAERPRLLLAIDGLDETDPPEQRDSLLHLLPRPEQLTTGLYLLLTSRRPQDADCPRWLGAALAVRVGAGPDAATRVIGLNDGGYLSLLRSYAAHRLGRPADKGFDALFQTILDKAEGRFVYVAFIVDRLLRGAVPLDRIDALAVGDGLYRDFLDRLDREFHPKLADAIRDVLLVLAAEEEAHDWMLGAGAQTDRATGGILKPVPELWPGLPLGALARHAALDTVDGSYDGRFVEILLCLQGVLAVSRGEAGAPRYRLGLKGLTQQIAAHPTLATRLPPVHAALAAETLDAIVTLEDEKAGAAEKKAASDRFVEGAAHAVPHLRLSHSEATAARWDVQRVEVPADRMMGELDRDARYGDKIAWYDLWLWWREEQLRGIGASTRSVTSTIENLANIENVANAYVARGNAKQGAPGHGATRAIADYDRAIALMEELGAALGEAWPLPWRNNLANASVARGNAKQDAPGHGATAAIADFDRAIALQEELRPASGEEWPVPWRNDLANAYMNRGVARRSAPGHGVMAAIADYDRAIALMEELGAALGESWPPEWRNHLATAYMNRGNAKQDAPGHGVAAAIADYDRAIALMEELRAALGEEWPVPWRNNSANAYINRGNAKQYAPRHGATRAIADYDRAIALMEELGAVLGESWPPEWRNHLATAYMNRGNAKQDAPGHGVVAAIADFDRAIALREELRRALGEDWPEPWRNDLANAYMNRGNAKQYAPGHGVVAAIADYNRAIKLMEELGAALGESWPAEWCNNLANTYMNRGVAKRSMPGHGADAIADYDRAIALMEELRATQGKAWPVPWRNDVAKAYMNRGNAKQDAPGHGAAAIADYDRAIALMEELRAALREDGPPPWRDDLAGAYVNRGVVKRSVVEHGAVAAITDFDRAIALREELRAALGDDWPVPWRNGLAVAYFNRALPRRQCGDRAGACADARRAESLWSDLVRRFGEGPWSGLAPRAAALCQQVCDDNGEVPPRRPGSAA